MRMNNNDYYVQALANALLGSMASGAALTGAQNLMPSVADQALAASMRGADIGSIMASRGYTPTNSLANMNAVPTSTGGTLASRGYPTTANYTQARMPSSPTNDLGYPNTNADAYRYRPGTGRR